jgi:hypothetical protein
MQVSRWFRASEQQRRDRWQVFRRMPPQARKETLICGRENRFLTLTAMKVPDKFVYVKNRSFDECSAECTRNCSCTAYAYANMSTTAINGDDTRCLLWMGDLIDTENSVENGENLYIRVHRLSGIFFSCFLSLLCSCCFLLVCK